MYETQNKNVIGHLAKSDLKAKKMSNSFIMITIILAAGLLMVMGLFPGSVKLDMQRELAQAQDVIYHNVTKEQIENLKKDDRLSYLTYDKLGERMEIDDYIIWQVYYDGASEMIKTMDLIEGSLPEAEHEIVVPKGYMKKIGKPAQVGTEIEIPFLSGEKEVCVVSGFTKDIKNSNIYAIVHSKAYAERGKALKDIDYDVLAKVDKSASMTQDEFLQTLRDVGTEAGVPRAQINENNNYLYTLPESLLSGDMIVMMLLGIVILVAGVMVIYSVFYISISGKTREYGQLRTLGMTKKQVRRLVRREGILLALGALPFGLVLGGLVSFFIRPGGFSIVNTLVMAAAVVVIILLTILVSIMKPAKLAAAVSPMEAARYSTYTNDVGRKKTKKTQRRITPFSLARMNTVRNRKKSFITMLSLGIGGMLFIGAVTFTVSVDSDLYVRSGEFQLGEFTISLSENATQTAKHGAAELQLNNPMTKTLKEEIRRIPGVEKIHSLKEANISYDYKDQVAQNDLVTPFAKSDIVEMKKAVSEGKLDSEKLLSGEQILIRNNDVVEEIYGWRFEPGDRVTIHYYDGAETFKTYEIGGVLKDYRDGLTDGWFMLPEEELERQMPGVDLTSTLVVETKEGWRDKVEEPLAQIAEENPQLSMSTLRQQEAQSQDMWNKTLLIIIGLVVFLILFSMLNLVNTLISNFMAQKTELAMLQSIGMTGTQIKRLIIGEGLILAIGNIAVSLILGSLIGYAVCSLMKNMGANYIVYQFPVLYSLVYAAVVILVPCLIALFLIRNFQKESLMDRLREV